MCKASDYVTGPNCVSAPTSNPIGSPLRSPVLKRTRNMCCTLRTICRLHREPTLCKFQHTPLTANNRLCWSATSRAPNDRPVIRITFSHLWFLLQSDKQTTTMYISRSRWLGGSCTRLVFRCHDPIDGAIDWQRSRCFGKPQGVQLEVFVPFRLPSLDPPLMYANSGCTYIP